MLISCPECQLQISDKAISCPHCGFPLKTGSVQTRQKRSTKEHRRLPNGFGQISKIKNKPLRNPYRAMVTVGKNPDTGRPIVKPLKPVSYFKTYNDAYEALLKYNRNPYEEPSSITVEELYKEWSKWYWPVLTPSAIENHTTAWNASKILYKYPVATLKAKNIRECIDGVNAITTKPRIKTLFSLMLDYAVEHEYCENNVAKLIKIDPAVSKKLNVVKTPHIAFTEDELNKMWKNITQMSFVDYVLIQCYMGLRPREMLEIKIENVDLENMTVICGMKTEAGRDRLVPIHSVIQNLVRMKYKVAKAMESRYLFNQPQASKISYTTYKKYFYQVIEELNLDKEHRPHDPRKTFVTLAKKYNVDEYAIKRIVGHAIGDLTEDRYTERSVEWLKEEIEKIKGPE